MVFYLLAQAQQIERKEKKTTEQNKNKQIAIQVEARIMYFRVELFAVETLYFGKALKVVFKGFLAVAACD